MILGVKTSVVFEERSFELKTGDVLLFYTDGLTEASNDRDELFGNERVCALLGTLRHLQAREIIDSIYAAVRDFTVSETFQDDISLVVLKIL